MKILSLALLAIALGTGCAHDSHMNAQNRNLGSAADLNGDAADRGPDGTTPSADRPSSVVRSPRTADEIDPEGDSSPAVACREGEVTRQRGGRIICVTPDEADRLDRTTGR